MSKTKAQKPEYNFINADTIHDEIIKTFIESMSSIGFDPSGIDNRNERKPRYISHNQVNYCLRQVYNKLFKPDKPLYNNQKSKINYDNIDVLQIIASTFIDICSMYNKSLGLVSFSYLTGISTDTLNEWSRGDNELNSTRSEVIKYIREGHKAAQVSLLNDSPVGSLAVANNDVETGLQWSEKQALASGNSTIYILPSERLQSLGVPGTASGRQIMPPE
jgi:hypothetical protein